MVYGGGSHEGFQVFGWKHLPGFNRKTAAIDDERELQVVQLHKTEQRAHQVARPEQRARVPDGKLGAVGMLRPEMTQPDFEGARLLKDGKLREPVREHSVCFV